MNRLDHFAHLPRRDNNVGYEPGQLGYVFPLKAKIDFQVAQYEALYGEKDRQYLMDNPLLGAAMWMIIAGPVMMGSFAVAIALIWGTIQVFWLITPIVALFLFGWWTWFGWLIYWKLPITAMIVHRGRGGELSNAFEWTDKWRARWNTEEYWAWKYGA